MNLCRANLVRVDEMQAVYLFADGQWQVPEADRHLGVLLRKAAGDVEVDVVGVWRGKRRLWEVVEVDVQRRFVEGTRLPGVSRGKL